MKCVIAAEPGSAEVIREKLVKTGLYKEWEFYLCTDVRGLFDWSMQRPDVVLVSRFLPGAEAEALVRRLKEFFPASHVVLLVGEVDEKCTAYIKLAREAGIQNIVTGKLPGDRPYTILAAFKYCLEDGKFRRLEWEDRKDAGTTPGRGQEEISFRQTTYSRAESGHPQQERIPASNIDFEPASRSDGEEDFIFDAVDIKNFREKVLAEILQEREKEKGLSPSSSIPRASGEDRSDRVADFRERLVAGPVQVTPHGGYDTGSRSHKTGEGEVIAGSRRQDARLQYGVTEEKGVLVLVAANKGGVGKTTVAITIATALARAGIPVVLWDLDFGGPDIASFFNLESGQGIEALAGKPVRRQYLELILTQPEENLYVLPGPMDKTLPSFQPEEIAQMASVLSGMFPVIIGDTPPEFWIKPWVADIFSLADKVLAVVDQSKFSEDETATYAPCLIGMGVAPEKISIVLNRFSPKLHSAREVEKCFNSGFRKEVPARSLPKVVATIPEDWTTYVLKGYRGEVVGLDDAFSQWHRLAADIASMAGYEYRLPEGDRKKKLLGFLRFKQ